MRMTLIISFLLSLFLSNILTDAHASSMPEFGMNDGRSQEGLVKIDLPMPIVKAEIKNLLLAEGSSITKINKFEMDPIKRVLFFDGEIELPESLLFTLEEQAGRSLKKRHDFSFTIGFPSSKMLAVTRYVQFKIHKFALDGVDYSHGFHIINRIVPALLANRSLVNYFMDESKLPTDFSDQDLSLKVKTLLDSKTFRFRDNTVSVLFDLKRFSDLKRFATILDDLRLWHFSPVLMKGTKDSVAFRIEAGLGKPGKEWVSDAKARQEHDETSLEKVREDLYKKYGYTPAIQDVINKILAKSRSKLGINILGDKEEREISNFKSNLISKAASTLDKRDVRFEADPQVCHEDFLEQAKSYTHEFLLDVKRRYMSEQKAYAAGRVGAEMPFLNKRISQNALNQFTNYFREFVFEGEQLFSKLTVQMAPHMPGVVVKGIVNLEMNTLMGLGLEGSGVDFSEGIIRADDKTYGTGIPFELSLYTFFKDNGVLELDVKQASIGEGLGKVILKNYSKNGSFLSSFTKMVIVQVMKTFLLDETVATEAISREELFAKIKQYKEKVLSTVGQHDLVKDLIALKKVDLQDPFSQVPAQVAGLAAEAFFKDLIGYNDKTGRLELYLDPSIFLSEIYGAKNTIELWNMQPIYDKQMDKVYVDIAAGDGVRTKKYLKHLQTRPEKRASDQFVSEGVDESKKSLVDYSLTMDFKNFSGVINRILTESASKHVAEVDRKLREDIEQSFYLLEDVTLSASDNGKLKLNITVAQKEKKKRGFFRRFFGSSERFEIISKRATVTAQVGLSVEKLGKYVRDLKLSSDEVFLGDKLIRIDFKNVGINIQDSGFINKAINFLAGDVNLESGMIGKRLKKLILKIMGPSLNATDDKNGNTIVGGIHLNEFVKVLTDGNEILLQVNPRFSGPVWDFYFLQTTKFNGADIGLVIDKASDSIRIDFTSAFALTTTDKAELYEVMAESTKMLEELDRTDENSLTAELILLYDKLINRSDYLNPSIYSRFKTVIENYDSITLLSRQELNTQLAFDQDERPKFTATGAELMQIAVVASTLSEAMDRVKELIEEQNSPSLRSYEQKLVQISKRMKRLYLYPLMKFYERNYELNNIKITQKDVTDWNHHYYPDAIFSSKAFEQLKSVYNVDN